MTGFRTKCAITKLRTDASRASRPVSRSPEPRRRGPRRGARREAERVLLPNGVTALPNRSPARSDARPRTGRPILHEEEPPQAGAEEPDPLPVQRVPRGGRLHQRHGVGAPAGQLRADEGERVRRGALAAPVCASSAAAGVAARRAPRRAPPDAGGPSPAPRGTDGGGLVYHPIGRARGSSTGDPTGSARRRRRSPGCASS